MVRISGSPDIPIIPQKQGGVSTKDRVQGKSEHSQTCLDPPGQLHEVCFGNSKNATGAGSQVLLTSTQTRVDSMYLASEDEQRQEEGWRTLLRQAPIMRGRARSTFV